MKKGNNSHMLIKQMKKQIILSLYLVFIRIILFYRLILINFNNKLFKLLVNFNFHHSVRLENKWRKQRYLDSGYKRIKKIICMYANMYKVYSKKEIFFFFVFVKGIINKNIIHWKTVNLT